MLVVGFLSVGLSGIVYLAAGPEVKSTEKRCIMAEEVKQQQTPAETPAQVTSPTSATDEQPSLLAAPRRVELEKSAEPKPGETVSFTEKPPKKKE